MMLYRMFYPMLLQPYTALPSSTLYSVQQYPLHLSILSLSLSLSLSTFSSSLPPIHIDPLFRGCVLILQESLYYSARNSTPQTYIIALLNNQNTIFINYTPCSISIPILVSHLYPRVLRIQHELLTDQQGNSLRIPDRLTHTHMEYASSSRIVVVFPLPCQHHRTSRVKRGPCGDDLCSYRVQHENRLITFSLKTEEDRGGKEDRAGRARC